MRKMKGLCALCIVTNQGGIPKYISRDDFETKLNAIKLFVSSYINNYDNEYHGVITSALYCASMDDDDPDRKPNTGMLSSFLSMYPHASKWFKNKSYMLMIGDASGKPGQFSDSDRKCAENFGIDYMDVEDFIKSE